MNNQYELVITVNQGNVDSEQKAINDTIADPFTDFEDTLKKYNESKASAKQSELKKFAKNTAVAVATKGSFGMLHSWSSTLGNSHTQDQLSALDTGVGFITQTAVLGATMGIGGVAISLLSELPNIVSKIINYTDRKVWDSIGQNKAVQRAGIIFSRSR